MSQPMIESIELLASAVTRPGPGRTANEDSLGLPDGISRTMLARKGRLYIVADGVGGHQAGNVASRIAVDVIHRTYYEDPDLDVAASLRRAIEAANAEVHHQARSPTYDGMGTTVVAAVVRGNDLIVANVGDSRAYLLRGGALQRLTSDHTWVAERVATGLLMPEEAAHHDMRHVVTRSLGDQPTVEVDVRPYRMLPRDRLLLCSDGLWESVPDVEITRLLGRSRPRATAAALVSRAVAAGSADDTTALVVAAKPMRAGVLGQVERAVSAAMASPQQRVLVIGAGAVLLLVLIVCIVTRPFPGGGAQGSATGTPTQGTSASLAPTPSPGIPTAATATSTSTATPPDATTAPSTVTPTPEAAPISAPAPTSTTYCVLPSTNPEAGPNDPANAVGPSTCQDTGEDIPVDADIWVPDQNTSQDCATNLIIEVVYSNRTYWIFPWRIGLRYSDGSCEPIADWRTFFATPR